MAGKIDRLSRAVLTVSLNTAEGTTEEIPYEAYAGGMVFIPSGSSITTLTWWAAPKRGGTFLAAKDEDAAAVTQTVAASDAIEIPKALYGAGAIKAVTNASGNVEISFKT